MSGQDVGLPEALERAANALPRDADAIWPANGDPTQLGQLLDADAAARVVSWLLANEPSAGEELAWAWAESADGPGAALLSIDPEGLSKPARKALRRVHHRLRSRGVDVPERERGSVVATLPPVDDSLEEACVSPLDPRGARVAYLALDHPSGGARLFEIVLDDVQGIVSFEVYNTGRSRVRRFLREFEQGGGLRAVVAPPEAIRALIARAAAAHPDSRPLPRGFLEWRTRLQGGPDGVQTPGERARASLAGSPPEDALARVTQWVQGGVLGPWPPAGERIDPIAERIALAGKGVVVVTGGARREQVERALEEAIDEIFDAEFAEITARRFEESAYVFWKGGRDDDARAVLAAADAFRAGSPRENPIARAMLEILFTPVLRDARGEGDAEDGEGGEEHEADGSLLVTP